MSRTRKLGKMRMEKAPNYGSFLCNTANNIKLCHGETIWRFILRPFAISKIFVSTELHELRHRSIVTTTLLWTYII